MVKLIDLCLIFPGLWFRCGSFWAGCCDGGYLTKCLSGENSPGKYNRKLGFPWSVFLYGECFFWVLGVGLAWLGWAPWAVFPRLAFAYSAICLAFLRT